MSHYYGTLVTKSGIEDFSGELKDIFDDLGKQDENGKTITDARVFPIGDKGALRVVMLDELDDVSYEYIIRPEDRCMAAPDRYEHPNADDLSREVDGNI